MRKEKLEATRQLQRIAALPYNPYFEKEISRVRRKYRIPKDKAKASVWFRNYWQRYGKASFLKFTAFEGPLVNPGGRGWRPVTDTELAARTPMEITDTEVPLEREVIDLLRRFRLRLWKFYPVLMYVLDNDKRWLDPELQQPQVLDSLYMYGDEIMLRVTVDLLTGWTTEKQWKEIWKYRVKPRLELLKISTREELGIDEPGRKRATVESYIKQMQQWAEWYQLSEIEGLGPMRALDKWEKDRPDQYGKYDLSTVTKAIKEFEEIITPLKD